jgi:hypothetical protein
VSADFESWSKESLVMFARDATERMAQQKVEIVSLQMRLDWAEEDTLVALAAYRDLLRGWPSADAAKGAARH